MVSKRTITKAKLTLAQCGKLTWPNGTSVKLVLGTFIRPHAKRSQRFLLKWLDIVFYLSMSRGKCNCSVCDCSDGSTEKTNKQHKRWQLLLHFTPIMSYFRWITAWHQSFCIFGRKFCYPRVMVFTVYHTDLLQQTNKNPPLWPF